ncbi:MAG TPA: ATP-binding protein [Oculatellaceae cyanobacterium]|jgi:signal transduction histidine kinase
MSIVNQLTTTGNQQQTRPVLVVEDPKGKRIINLDKNIYSLGRSSLNSIVLNSRIVSRHHATLLRVTDTENETYLFQIIDGNLQGQHSTNGLIINGRSCWSKALQHKDLIIFGGNVQASYFVIDANLSDEDIFEYCEQEKSLKYQSFANETFETLVPDDISVDPSSEAALLRLASFPELLPTPIIEIDLQGKITYCNPATLVQFPDVQELQLNHPILLGILSVVQNEKKEFFVREVEVENAIFEQSVHYIAESNLIRIYLGDITKRKQAEKEREQLLISEQAARAEAEAANRMKDEFLATLSHELRTPLNAMIGWTSLLRSRKLDEKTVSRAIETIERNTRSLAQLIEDVLDVSRIIRGKLRLNVRSVKLIPIIEAAIETIRPAADAKNIQIECFLDAAVPPILGDANRLQQVVWNLLSNAVKFTPQSSRVEVRLLLSTDTEMQGNSAQIRVSDAGIGINPDFLPHVFDRFSQADSSTTRAHGGLGLGLAIVRHLVELQGGTVKAESAGEGLGATFLVNLPLIAANQELAVATPEAENTTKPHSVVSIQPPVRSLAGLRVLVVDDQADTREFLITMLHEYGAEATAVETVSEALETLQHWKPNVLISDIGMPGEDGYALIRKIRAMTTEEGGNIPAIALTGYASASDRTQALLAGFQIHVPKPIDAVELAVVVGKLTGRIIN